MKNFIESITLNKKLLVDGFDGLNTLQIGLASLESAKKNKTVQVNETILHSLLEAL